MKGRPPRGTGNYEWLWFAVAVLVTALFADAYEKVSVGGLVVGSVGDDHAVGYLPVGWRDAQQFARFMRDEPKPPPGTFAAREYTRKGLRRLAAALAEVASHGEQPGDVTRQIIAMRAASEALADSASSTHYPVSARRIMDESVSAALLLQARRFPDAGARVDAMREAARTISPTRPLAEQRTAVKTFFARSLDVIQAMGALSPR